MRDDGCQVAFGFGSVKEVEQAILDISQLRPQLINVVSQVIRFRASDSTSKCPETFNLIHLSCVFWKRRKVLNGWNAPIIFSVENHFNFWHNLHTLALAFHPLTHYRISAHDLSRHIKFRSLALDCKTDFVFFRVPKLILLFIR